MFPGLSLWQVGSQEPWGVVERGKAEVIEERLMLRTWSTGTKIGAYEAELQGFGDTVCGQICIFLLER